MFSWFKKIFSDKPLVPVLVLVLWALGTYHFHKSLQLGIKEKHEKAFGKASIIIEDKIASYIYGLQGMGGVIHAHALKPNMTQMRNYSKFRDDFKNFTGALGFGFIRVVPRNKFSEYEKRNNLRIREIAHYTGDGYIIEVIEPFEKNQSARGLNIASEAHRLKAANHSRDHALPALTAPITLVQAEKKGFGFLYFLPIYKESTPPKSLTERRSSIIGFAYSPILIAPLINHLKESTAGSLEYHLTDVTDKMHPFKIYGNDLGPDAISREMKVGSRTWRLAAITLDTSAKFLATTLSLLVFILGMVILFALLSLWQNHLSRQETTENKVRTIESWQKSVLSGTNYSMVATDLSGVITIFNHAAELMTGYLSEEMIGKNTPAIFHDPQEIAQRTKDLESELSLKLEPGFETFVIKSRTTGLPDRGEWTYVRKDGTRIPVSLSVTTICDSESNIVGYLGVAEDISELKRLALTVSQQQETLVNSAKMSALGEMAGGIAHEINNPLAIISGQVALMKDMEKHQELSHDYLNRSLDKIDATIVRIGKIIKGLRTFSRDGSKDPPVPTIVMKIIDDTLDLCRERFIKHGIEIVIKGNQDQVVNCRPVEISQVLMNLLLNSFDAVSEVSHKLITISVSADEKATFIVITDTGMPIPKNVARRIMEPFYTTKEVGKGTGLGLSISRGIMESHGGKLTYNFHSPETQFILEFPHA